MSSHVELCEHHANDCLQATEKTEDPLAREMLLRHLEWMQDGLAASKQRASASRPSGNGATAITTWSRT
jgi:hypothetical protein